MELSGGGVDVVLDPVGGDRFTDSLRCLREGGRLVVVGFTGGSIPEVRVNRLLLKNTEVVGAGWGAYVMGKPDLNREIGAAVNRMVDDGVVRADRRRALPPGARRRGAEGDRRASRDRQGRAGRARRLSPQPVPRHYGLSPPSLRGESRPLFGGRPSDRRRHARLMIRWHERRCGTARRAAAGAETAGRDPAGRARAAARARRRRRSRSRSWRTSTGRSRA